MEQIKIRPLGGCAIRPAEASRTGQAAGMLRDGRVQRILDRAGDATSAWRLPRGSSIATQERERLVAQLISAGLLDVEVDPERFLCGEAAHEFLFGPLAGEPALEHPLQRLSRIAIEYAERLGRVPVQELARRLYIFNSLPAPLWREAGARRGGEPELTLGRALGRGHARVDDLGAGSAGVSPWAQWRRLDAPSDLRFKIYVSPGVQGWRAFLSKLGRACGELRVPSLKVARVRREC
jgi:hypothetical protein